MEDRRGQRGCFLSAEISTAPFCMVHLNDGGAPDHFDPARQIPLISIGPLHMTKHSVGTSIVAIKSQRWYPAMISIEAIATCDALLLKIRFEHPDPLILCGDFCFQETVCATDETLVNGPPVRSSSDSIFDGVDNNDELAQITPMIHAHSVLSPIRRNKTSD